MLLAIDVGNSHTSVGVFVGEQLRCESRFSTRRAWTRDEVAISLRDALALRDVAWKDVQAAIVACVVPPALGAVVQALETYVELRPVIVGPGVKTGMPIRYDPPQDVGADRIVSAVAAHARYARDDAADHRPVIVVDFGTATTFDAVSATPEYLGGCIAPGVGISADALFERAAKLPRVDLARPDRVIGRNTVNALQSGLLYGYVGLVEGMLRRISSELGDNAVVVATGGFARSVAAETEAIDHVDDSLMLEGLRLIHTKNGRG